MKSRLHRTKSPSEIKWTVKQWWYKSLTSSLYPDAGGYVKDSVMDVDSNIFQPRLAKEVVQYLKHLAMVGIDKCMGRSLLLCPVLFQRFYMETFPVCSDSDHYLSCGLSVKEGLAQLTLDSQKFDIFGTDLPRADIPTPYFLPKLKDVVAE